MGSERVYCFLIGNIFVILIICVCVWVMGRTVTYDSSSPPYIVHQTVSCLNLWKRQPWETVKVLEQITISFFQGLRWNDTPCSFETYFVCEVWRFPRMPTPPAQTKDWRVWNVRFCYNFLLKLWNSRFSQFLVRIVIEFLVKTVRSCYNFL